MTTAPLPATELPLAAPVLVAGRVVGRSEFETGRPTYLVEFTVRGKPQRDWFFADELDDDAGEVAA